MLSAFAEKLKEALLQDLPGEKAHEEMMPYKRISAVQARMDGNPRLSAVMALIWEENAIPYIVLIKRTVGGTHSGQMAFPGGKKENTDETLQATAIRETFEEIGIHHNHYHILGALSEVYIPPSNFIAQPFVAWLKEKPLFIKENFEVQEIFIASLPELFDPKNRLIKPMELPTYDITLNVPYFDMSGHTVWGATALMLNELRWIFEQVYLETGTLGEM